LVASINRTVQTPRIASVAEVTVVSLPAILVVTAEQVIVLVLAELLYREIASPAAKIDAGTIIPADKDKNLPTSVATSVPVAFVLDGIFK